MKFKFNSLERTGLVLFFVCTILAGCASLPSQFANENPPLSQTNQNIVIAAATIRQDIAPAETVVETAAPLVFSQLAKQPTTQARDGLLLYDLGVGLAAFTGTGTAPTNIVASMAGSLNTSLSVSTDNIIQTVVNDAQAPITNEVTQLENLANSATNPDVKTYVLATIPIVVNGIGVSLETSFGSYAPAPATATAMLKERRLYFAQVRAHAKATMLSLVNCPDLTTLYLRKFARD